MGDISIIARRLKDGHVQYGWSGNGGYFRSVGVKLLAWYDTPEMVEYLFSLGELELLYEPHSESTSRMIRNRPTGIPHNLGLTEREIFSRIVFIDYGYFYDLDGQWYEVFPGRFRIKIPLEEVGLFLLDQGDSYEYTLKNMLEARVLQEIAGHWFEEDPAFRSIALEHDFDPKSVLEIAEKTLNSRGAENDPYIYLDDKRWLTEYLDDWVVFRGTDTPDQMQIQMRRKETPRIETIDW